MAFEHRTGTYTYRSFLDRPIELPRGMPLPPSPDKGRVVEPDRTVEIGFAGIGKLAKTREVTAGIVERVGVGSQTARGPTESSSGISDRPMGSGQASDGSATLRPS